MKFDPMMQKGYPVKADLIEDKINLLKSGAELLAPLLVSNGFTFEVLGSGKGSGGTFASGQFQAWGTQVRVSLSL